MCVANDPDDVMLLESLALVLFNDERYADAHEAARAAATKDPTVPGPHDAMASIMARMGEPGEALKELDAAIRLNPHLLEYRAKRGAALNQLGRHADALAEFNLVIKADPGFFTA